MRPRHSFLLRWRRFINAPGQVLPGPSPGRAGHRTPGVPASLSERVPGCHRFPCCATVLPIRPKCSRKTGIARFPWLRFPQPSGSEREEEEEQDGKNGHGIPKRRTGNHHCLTLVCRDNRFQCVPEPVFLDAAFSMHWRGTENERGFLSRSATRIPSRRKGC